MAVFGVPRGARGRRAQGLPGGGRDAGGARRSWACAGRIGVNTGEVVTGTEERLAAGDMVNVAARLEQNAEPGRVLIGAGDARSRPRRGRERAGRAARAEGEARGRSPPTGSSRCATAPERSHASRFVGRERELELLRDAWERARAGERCELVTVVGEAGVGKSRLVAEALAAVDARIVRGRCLPYGEGITYWPVVEVVKQLQALPADPAAAAAIRSLLGESDTGTSAEEIAWAFRKLLEEQAPLVVVLDDVQWGGPTFLDLVDGVALLSSEAPILLVCMGGPELLAHRADWPVALRLAPLPRRRPTSSSRARTRAAGADRPGRRRQPALPHRDGGDGRRDRGGRGAADAARAARGPARPARPGGTGACSSGAPSRESCSTAAPSRRSPPRRPSSRRASRG